MATIIGTTLAKKWPDGTGCPHQSHLIYAVNNDRWWYFSLDSTLDSFATHVHTVHVYYSSGPDLATATWTAHADMATASHASATSELLGGGRSLGVLYLNNGGTDVVHVRTATSDDGQTGSNNHIRGTISGTTITWQTGNSQNGWLNIAAGGASQWNGPKASDGSWTTGLSAVTGNASWNDVMAASSGGFIHSFGAVQDGEIDMNVMKSRFADVSGSNASWTNDWDVNLNCGPAGTGGDAGLICLGRNGGLNTRPTAFTVDNSMAFQCKRAGFAALDGDQMLTVYTDGQAAQPNMLNCRAQRTGAPSAIVSSLSPAVVQAAKTGWNDPGTQDQTGLSHNGGTAPGANTGVFLTDLTQDQNDWSIIGVDTTHIYICRRGSTTQIDVRQFNPAYPNVYNTTGGGDLRNAFSTPSQPPALTGKTIKAATTGTLGQGASGGVMTVTNGVDFWVFVIDTTDNAIKGVKYDVGSDTWGAWTVVEASIGATACFLSGHQKVGSNQCGLVFSVINADATNYDTKVTSLRVPYEAPISLVKVQSQRRRRSQQQ